MADQGWAGKLWTRLTAWRRPKLGPPRPKLGLWDCPLTRERCSTVLTCEYVCRRAFLGEPASVGPGGDDG